jgi:hypothetical protein
MQKKSKPKDKLSEEFDKAEVKAKKVAQQKKKKLKWEEEDIEDSSGEGDGGDD